MHALKKINDYELDVFTFVKDFLVRWNTTFYMLQRLFTLKQVYIDLTTNSNEIENIKVYFYFN